MATLELDESAGELDIRVHEGADVPISILWADENNSPIDLTGWSAKMQVRSKRKQCGTLKIDLSSDAGDIVLGGVAGTIVISIPAADNSLGSSINFYDLDLIDPIGKVNTIMQGKYISSSEVTT